MVDDDLWWLWCGTECWGSFIGPHLSLEAAEADKETSGCEHDHMTAGIWALVALEWAVVVAYALHVCTGPLTKHGNVARKD